MSCRDESFITGWSIYPLGYYYGYLMGAVVETLLNVVYNVAEIVNKIAFMLACWCAAKAESEGKRAMSCRDESLFPMQYFRFPHPQQHENHLHRRKVQFDDGSYFMMIFTAGVAVGLRSRATRRLEDLCPYIRLNNPGESPPIPP